MGKLTDEERAEFAALRAANLASMQELQADIARRGKIIQLSDHRREPEPNKEAKMSTLSDFQISQMVAALKAETEVQLRDHHDFLKALVEAVYGDLFKMMKKEIAKVRRELAELRAEFGTAKAVDDGKVAIIRKERA